MIGLESMKVRIPSGIFAGVCLACGAYFFVVIPKFLAIYKDLYGPDVSLPLLTRVVVGVTPLGWLVLAGIMAALVILRDVRGRGAWLPNWVAVLIFLVTGLFVVVALCLPLTAATSIMSGG